MAVTSELFTNVVRGLHEKRIEPLQAALLAAREAGESAATFDAYSNTRDIPDVRYHVMDFAQELASNTAAEPNLAFAKIAALQDFGFPDYGPALENAVNLVRGKFVREHELQAHTLLSKTELSSFDVSKAIRLDPNSLAKLTGEMAYEHNPSLSAKTLITFKDVMYSVRLAGIVSSLETLDEEVPHAAAAKRFKEKATALMQANQGNIPENENTPFSINPN